MAVAASIKIVKTIAWKGGIQEWSNRYHFNGALPPDDTHWLALANAINLVEKTCYYTNTHIVRAVGYDAGSDVPVYTHDFAPIAGTGAFADDIQASEVAAL